MTSKLFAKCGRILLLGIIIIIINGTTLDAISSSRVEESVRVCRTKKCYKRLYEELQHQVTVLKNENQLQERIIQNLRDISIEAQQQLASITQVTQQVDVNCTVFCNGRGFAPGCKLITNPSILNNLGYDTCTTPIPMGLGLLTSIDGIQLCCTNTTTTPCRLVGPGSETSCQPCSNYPPLSSYVPNNLLFNPINRIYNNVTGICSST